MDDHESISTLFERQAACTPDAVALQHGRNALTYRALNAHANQLARYLGSRIGPGRRTAVCADRGFALMTTLLAIAKAGGAYVPLEPTHPPARIAAILAAARPDTLVTDVRRPATDLFDGGIIVLDERADDIARERTDDLEVVPTRDALFAVLFTSGTTGAPKGILRSMASTVRLLFGMWDTFPLGAEEVSLMHRSATVIGTLWEYFGALLRGVRSVVLAGDDARDPETIWKHLVEHRVTRMTLSPTLAQAVVRHGERRGLTSDALRLTLTGGEPVSRELVVRWRRVFPQSKIVVGYGATEMIYAAFYDASQPPADDDHMPVGVPFAGATIHIVNDAMDGVDANEEGEICVAGPYIARGYLNDPRLTAERFAPNQWASTPGEVLYRTGDLGRWRSDGLLEVRGRLDRQVKLRGFRVELDEIEAAVRRVSGAATAAVLVSADPRGRPMLVAYLETSASIVADDLRQMLRREIPEHMIPSRFVSVDSLPLTDSGKPDRRALTGLSPVPAVGAC